MTAVRGNVHHGDCLDVMATMEPESVDAIVTDPPYGLEFMGKEWDRLGRPDWAANKSSGRHGGGTDPFTTHMSSYQGGPPAQEFHQQWAEAAYRVAKPSAYLLAFGGTRTFHRLACAMEDAGWIIRDTLVWGYASGFPKSKASLKPAWEPIVMARKPGPLRELAIDACRIGTAGIGYIQPRDTTDTDGASWSKGDHRSFHYDDGGSRVAEPDDGFISGWWDRSTDETRALLEVEAREVAHGREGEASATRRYVDEPGDFSALSGPRGDSPLGRWPANIMLTDPIFDGGWEGVVGGGETGPAGTAVRRNGGGGDYFGSGGPKFKPGEMWPDMTYGDSGTYSRFFLIPKADRADREPVLGGLPEQDYASGAAHKRCAKCGKQEVNVHGSECQCAEPEWVRPETARKRANVHPTVKPTDLMRHLVRLVTPAGGVVLDPFLGSGTTALAAEMEGFDWIGIEKEAEYVAIAEARLNGTQRGLGLGA